MYIERDTYHHDTVHEGIPPTIPFLVVPTSRKCEKHVRVRCKITMKRSHSMSEHRRTEASMRVTVSAGGGGNPKKRVAPPSCLSTSLR